MTELFARDKASLDVLWLKDDALEASANLPAPHLIAAEIVEDLRAALEAFEGLPAPLLPRQYQQCVGQRQTQPRECG